MHDYVGTRGGRFLTVPANTGCEFEREAMRSGLLPFGRGTGPKLAIPILVEASDPQRAFVAVSDVHMIPKALCVTGSTGSTIHRMSPREANHLS